MAYPTIKVEIAFATAPLAVTPTWTDVTAYVQAIPSIRRGRPSPLNGVEAGTAVVVLRNRDRRFDPTYTSGAYYPDVVPMRKIRISATWASTTHRIFTGYIEDWPPAWEASNTNSTVTVTASDGFKYFNLLKISGAVVAEFSNWAIDTRLTSANWPAADRALSSGKTFIDGFTATNKNLLQHLQDIVEAENGLFFVRGDGYAVFQDRHYRLTNGASTTAQATFGDGGGAELPYQAVAPSYDDAQIWNDVRVSSAATGTEQVASDATSQTNYFKRTLVKSNLLIGNGASTPDNEAAGLAAWLLYTYKDPALRFDAMTLLGNYADTLWPQLLARDISDRITVKRRPPPSGSAVITQDCWIEAIEHRITDITATYLHWETTWQLSPSNTTTWWILNDATFSVLGTSTRVAH